MLLFVLLVLQGCSSGGGDGATAVAQNAEDPAAPPAVLGAISTSNTSVLVSFSKTMNASAANTANYVITQENVNPEVGTILITGAEFLLDDHRSIVLHTSAQNEVTYRVTVVNVKDVNSNPLAQKTVGANGAVIDPSSAVFPGTAPGLIFVTFGTAGWEDNNGNGVVDVGDSVLDTNGNRIVLVDADSNGVFDNVLDAAGWEDNNDNGVVDVGDSIINGDGDRIALVDDNFDGVIDNFTDTNGNGTVDVGEVVAGLRDTDGDGLPDNVELRGTVVYVDLGNGQFTTRQATSDPYLPDTDGDGLSDLEEWNIGTDPRNRDSDNDGLSDYTEWNVIYSSPIAQDTDQDGVLDGLEHSFYHTSPLLADTDGDKLGDDEELFELNRDPLVADLPKVSIDVGDVRLQIDERFTYTDETGNTVIQESSTSTSLANSQSSSYSHSDSGAFEWAADLSVRTGIGNGSFFGGDKGLSGGVEVTASGHVGGSTSWETDTSSAQESQQAYENSLNKGREYSATSSATREVVGARIDVDLTVSNIGNVPFSVSNLEVTVLEPSPVDSGKLVPVATLVSNSELITGTPLVVNLGPFNSQRGPFVFANREVFPNLVEALMRNPRGLVFRVANYDITDELGRNFAFSEQLARDRTASISLDEGDAAAAQTYQVATSGTLDVDNFVNGGYVGGFSASDGKALGLPLDYLLQARLGLKKHDTSKDIIVPGPDGVLNSIIAGDDVETDGVIGAGPNGWLETTPGGDDYVSNPTEQDGIVAGLNKTADSIAQGDDIQLVPVGTTGLSVGTVVIGAGENGKLDTPALADDKPEFVTGYETQRTCAATSTKNAGDFCRIESDCRSSATAAGSCSGPQRLVRVNSLRDGDYNRGWYVLTDGEVPAAANFGDIVVKPGKNLTLAFLQDLDKDSVFARTEFLYGTVDSAEDKLDNSKFGVAFDENVAVTCPSGDSNACDGIADSKDTDHDGIGDFAEINVGWKVVTDGGPLRQVYSNPRLRDSDGDGLQDLEEQDLGKYCAVNDPRVDGLCVFPSQLNSVTQDKAIAIIAGKDGKAQSIAGDTNGDGVVDSNDEKSDDLQVMLLSDPASSLYMTVINPGDNGKIETALRGDDLYVSSTFVWPATDPSSSDTDLDGVKDKDELVGYDVGLAIVDGGNGIVDVERNGDDVQKVPFGNPVSPGGIIILPGANGAIDTNTPQTDDVVFSTDILCGPNVTSDTMAIGDDIQAVPVGGMCSSLMSLPQNVPVVRAGPNGVIDSIPNNAYDHVRQAHQVITDPLRRDTDNDTNADGLEITLGSDPTVADGADFRDSDRDGLTDNEESSLGWTVTVNGSSYVVKSSPNLIDTDGDGLPDFIERDLRTDPNKVDTDGDGISDYDEVQDFERFVRLMAAYPAVVINGSGSARYGTDPLKVDTDGDGLSDYQELIDGFRMTLPGDAAPRLIFTSAVHDDTDGDGLTDQYEVTTSLTDPTNNDTDGDGRSDGAEKDVSDPLVPDIAYRIVTRYVTATAACKDTVDSFGELAWWFVLQPVGENPVLLSDAFDAEALEPAETGAIYYPDNNAAVVPPLGQTTWPIGDDGWPVRPDGCYAKNLGGPIYVLNFNKQSETYAMKQGESIRIQGLAAELDGTITTDCGMAPRYIPTNFTAGQQAYLLDKTVFYDDMANSSGITLTSADATALVKDAACTIDYKIDIEVIH